MIILASNSPRRKELLKKIISSSFVCIPAHIDEIKDERLPAEENAKINALKKGLFVYNTHKEDTIISADTIVVLDNIIYGKPKDDKEAKLFLETLSNKTHKVITAYFIKNKEKEILKTVTSLVTFKKLNNKIIDEYVDSKSPLDKAGAYGIQDEFSSKIISSYLGSINNIIGLPIEEIKLDLEKFTY